VLVHAVAEAQGCRAVRLVASAGERQEQIAIVGFASDLRWVETLVTSLLVQLTSAMLDQCPAGLTPSASAGWRRSFIVGFAETVAERLETDRRDRVVEHDRGTPTSASSALVLVERHEEVTVEFRRRFPRIRSSWASSGSSRSGAAAGRRAGQDASFGSRSVAGRRALGPG
jgi:type II secretory pathway component PulM